MLIVRGKQGLIDELVKDRERAKGEAAQKKGKYAQERAKGRVEGLNQAIGLVLLATLLTEQEFDEHMAAFASVTEETAAKA